MKKLSIIVCIFVLLASCGPTYLEPYDEPVDVQVGAYEEKDYIRIVSINVGQGDSTLVVGPSNKAVLIDSGPAGEGYSSIIPLLLELGIGSIDYIIATHYHADHISGLPEVIAGPDGKAGTDDDIVPRYGVLDRGLENNSEEDEDHYEKYASSVANLRHEVVPGESIELDGVEITVVSANGHVANGQWVDLSDSSDENAKGISLLINYGDFKMFVAGDITGGGGEAPFLTPDVEKIVAPITGKINVLRVAHHGSKTSSSENFLDITQPEAAIISVGPENKFGHPSREVLDRLLSAGTEVFTTVDGNVQVEADRSGKYSVSY